MSSCQHLFNSFLNFIFLCLNLFTEPPNHNILQEPNNSSSPCVSPLPTSVVLEILLKLPINSIIKCKRVCKSWHNLISSDPYFTSTYLTNPPFAVVVGSEHRTITNPLDDSSFYFIEVGRNGDVSRAPFTPNAFESNGMIGIMGSCNGVLCFVRTPNLENERHGSYMDNRDSVYNHQTVCLVNPLRGESVLLPDFASAENIHDVIYGFGFGISSNECKVVRIVITHVSVGVGHEIKVSGEILTVGVDGRWRYFEDSCIPCYVFPRGINLKGNLHWIGDDRRCGLILAFDIGEEKWDRLALPQGLGDVAGNIILAVWDGCLCITDNGGEDRVDVWVMKEYGVAESWTREVILRSWIPRDVRPYSLIPITTLRNGDLLLSRPYGQSLVSFDPKTKRCATFDVEAVEGTVSFLVGYTPTFFGIFNGSVH